MIQSALALTRACRTQRSYRLLQQPSTLHIARQAARCLSGRVAGGTRQGPKANADSAYNAGKSSTEKSKAETLGGTVVSNSGSPAAAHNEKQPPDAMHYPTSHHDVKLAGDSSGSEPSPVASTSSFARFNARFTSLVKDYGKVGHSLPDSDHLM